MTCKRELEQLSKDSARLPMPPAELDVKSYKSGFADGYLSALGEALEIVEAHEDEGE